MEKMRPTRKRSFLLLELVISLILIVFCLFPLLKPNIALYQLSKKRLAACENYSLDYLLLAAIKKDLFEARHSWEQLKAGVTTKEYSIKAVATTDRESLEREGLLLEAVTPYGTHKIFVERAL